MPAKESPQPPPSNQTDPSGEPVWTYRGYRLRPGDFTTAMVHLFRAEIARANVWRQRLDATTNWAVITTGAAITIAFNPTGYHAVIIISTLLVTLFLIIEARRYRYYELWSYRVRLMETDFYAGMLVAPFHPSPEWAESLASNLLHPEFPISMWEAFGRRFRRNYMLIYLILGSTWLAKTALLPVSVTNWEIFLARAAVGGISGELVLLIGVVFNAVLLLIGLFTSGMHRSTGEVLPRFTGDDVLQDTFSEDSLNQTSAWFRLSRRRQQVLAYIITDQAEALSQAIMKEMQRGVTGFPATGMYTQSKHFVLLCALTITEVNRLKSIVSTVDSRAFLIVSPAREIIGQGFVPLD